MSQDISSLPMILDFCLGRKNDASRMTDCGLKLCFLRRDTRRAQAKARLSELLLLSFLIFPTCSHFLNNFARRSQVESGS